jgi:hypothetical protein
MARDDQLESDIVFIKCRNLWADLKRNSSDTEKLLKQLIECIDELRPEVPKEHIPALERQITKPMKTMKAATPQTVADVKFTKAVPPKPVPPTRVPKKKVVNIKEVRQPTFQTAIQSRNFGNARLDNELILRRIHPRRLIAGRPHEVVVQVAEINIESVGVARRVIQPASYGQTTTF